MRQLFLKETVECGLKGPDILGAFYSFVPFHFCVHKEIVPVFVRCSLNSFKELWIVFICLFKILMLDVSVSECIKWICSKGRDLTEKSGGDILGTSPKPPYKAWPGADSCSIGSSSSWNASFSSWAVVTFNEEQCFPLRPLYYMGVRLMVRVPIQRRHTLIVIEPWFSCSSLCNEEICEQSLRVKHQKKLQRKSRTYCAFFVILFINSKMTPILYNFNTEYTTKLQHSAEWYDVAIL